MRFFLKFLKEIILIFSIFYKCLLKDKNIFNFVFNGNKITKYLQLKDILLSP